MNKGPMEKTALSITKWIGSSQSIVVHSAIFIVNFGLAFLRIIPFDRMLLVLTTVVSLEAIYLSIFIQMSVNRTTQSLQEVEHDIDEIQEDIDEIQEDVDEIQEDVDEIQEDVGEIQEDVEEMTDEEKAEEKVDIAALRAQLERLIVDLDRLQKES